MRIAHYGARSLRLAILIGALALMLGPAPVAADCDLQRRAPMSVAAATGDAFIGAFQGDDSGAFPRQHRWRVDRVVRGAVPGDSVTYQSIACHGLNAFVVGRTYLVSSADLANPDAGNTVAWEIDGEDVKLVAFELPRKLYPDVWRVDSLEAALSLVGPGGLPPTDVGAARGIGPWGGDDGWVFASIFLASFAVISLALLGRRVRPVG